MAARQILAKPNISPTCVARGEGKGIQLKAPLRTSLERAVEYIDIDEYVEATPKLLRLRKRILDATARTRATVAAAQFG